jgi:hypothetical protein
LEESRGHREQTTFDRIFSPVVNSRNSILRGELDDLPPVGGPDGVRKHEQALDIIRSHGLEGQTDVLDRAFDHRKNIKMLFRGRLLKPCHRLRMITVVGVEEDREPRCPRQQLHQEPEILAARPDGGKSGDVSTGLRVTCR